MNTILSDTGFSERLLPLSYTRSVADFRVGILTIKEKWERLLNSEVSVKTKEYLQPKYKLRIKEKNLVINSTVMPDLNIKNAVLSLEQGALVKEDTVIAVITEGFDKEDFFSTPKTYKKYDGEIITLKALPDIFVLNDSEIKSDFKILTANRKSGKISNTNIVLGDADKIFVEDNAYVEGCTLNTTDGPIYLGRNSQLMEGSNIRGSFALCDNAVVKMSAKIYGATTIGPKCKVGGEINNSVFLQNSNKAHDGFLGNAVIGEWCNLGADTNNSNLKNNYANVKIWDYHQCGFVDTGLQFCGLIMGDHSKTGINTMFNTGTVVGVSANIFGSNFPRNFVPSFTWGGHAGVKEYKLDKALETMGKVLQRRDKKMTNVDIDIIREVFELSAKFRHK